VLLRGGLRGGISLPLFTFGGLTGSAVLLGAYLVGGGVL
jgi:hypothetical protein